MKYDDLAVKILVYLSENPKAQDTIYGIAHWWLLQQEIQNSLRAVRSALEALLEDGLVIKVEPGDDRHQAHYRVDAAKFDEIDKIVSSLP